MPFRIGLIALALTPLFAQQAPTPADAQRALQLAAQSLREATAAKNQAVKLQKLDEAAEGYLRVLRVDPHNAKAYYSLGVIAWMRWSSSLRAARIRLGLKPGDPRPLEDEEERRDLAENYGAAVEEGIENLEKALEIHPAYRDARVYQDRLIRAREEYLLMRQATPPPPPPPPPVMPPPTRIRAGGNAIQGNMPTKIPRAPTPVIRVEPEYPRQALETGVQGTVVLWAIINKEGHVEGFNQALGPPLLVQAAQDAVYQWVFKPTLLNGAPILVVRQIDVPFVLPAAK